MFRGVGDALVGGEKNREYRRRREQLVSFAQAAAQLSEERYRGGAAGYLDVLTNETNAFDSDLGLAPSQVNGLVSLSEIYRNLSGGWNE